ncbi:hypothetical protein DB30_00205 [Enhygromyxa salina]|uniref:Glycosyl transferase family 2 n=2 Tax=Enhygromyxa salina TaxID=215803 RepID=A0A0C2DAH8_9BACT|nr:hypothetical protein DB30_00205 [Enhygromyxa salina]
MTSLSIVIPWANRDELAHTLLANAPQLARYGAELVVVDCGGDPGRCLAALERAGVPVTLVEVPTDGFNKALALNLGVHAASGDALMFLDTDVILTGDWLADALAAVEAGSFVTVERVRESAPSPDPIPAGELQSLAHIVEFVTAAGEVIRVETNRRQFADASRGGPGLICLRRDHFVSVDGMNSDLLGWGWEDVDLVARLQLAGVAPRLAMGEALHLSHDDSVRVVNGGARAHSERNNFSVCVANYRLGWLSGTFADDVQTCAALITTRTWTPRPATLAPQQGHSDA